MSSESLEMTLKTEGTKSSFILTYGIESVRDDGVIEDRLMQFQMQRAIGNYEISEKKFGGFIIILHW